MTLDWHGKRPGSVPIAHIVEAPRRVVPAGFLRSDASDAQIDDLVRHLLGTGIGTLYTFGYQGLRDSAALRELLGGTDCKAVIDVRLSRWSRNDAFSLRTRDTVKAAGFSYVHLPDLGNLAYRSGGIRIKNIEAIEHVLDLLRAGRSVALMCACSTPKKCHRALLAEEAVRREPGLQIVHLPSEPQTRQRAARPR